jgi:DNA (cytosine-5)-methyltransferase 1
MNYLSVCSGIEAATVAWHGLGFNPVGFSEIEKFPCKLLDYHYPEVKNYGDMTKYKDWKNEKSVNILIGGTPCQSFSVAGLRKGLNDPRGNLMLTYCAIADYYRPEWLIWENVPGVLSSNRGRDFGTFLGALGILGYGVAYRVLDAQNFGVAQRRRRVFVVGHLGDWRRCAAVLFERESMQGNTKKGGNSRETTSRGIEIGPSGGKFTELNPTLDTGAKDGPVRNQLSGAVLTSKPIGIAGNILGRKEKNGGHQLGISENKPMFTLTKTDVHAVSYYENYPADSRVTGPHEIGNSVTARYGPGGGNVPLVLEEKNISVVRRLTPKECERLQGFPDDYTNIPGASDSARYKALGNSMAVPVIKWLGERIIKYSGEIK